MALSSQIHYYVEMCAYRCTSFIYRDIYHFTNVMRHLIRMFQKTEIDIPKRYKGFFLVELFCCAWNWVNEFFVVVYYTRVRVVLNF